MTAEVPAVPSGARRLSLTARLVPACAGLFIFFLLLPASGALPPKPDKYVEDTAGILSPQEEAALNSKLEQFERNASCQVLVATFPEVPAEYQMEDFTQRTAEAWGVGQKKTDNGAVLFLFPGSRKLRIEVGYGLEGAIPDALAKRIIEREIVPSFRAGDFDGGVARGVDAILAATKGEYSGTGRTVADQQGGDDGMQIPVTLLILIFIALFVFAASRRNGACFGPAGRRSVWLPSSSDSWGGGSGGGFGGGGGFSGGGGSFGGGGASGGW